MRPTSTSTCRSPTGIDSTCPPWPAAVGAVKPGTSAIGTTAVGGPSSSTAGAQPDPSTIATSWSATPVRWAMTDAASSAMRVGSAVGTTAA